MRARPDIVRIPWWHARPFYLLLFKSFLWAIVALAAVICWLRSMPNMSGIRIFDFYGRQFISEHCRIILVRPEWIRSRGGIDPGLVGRWESAEMKARAIVVFILWAVGVSLLIWRYSRRPEQTRPVNLPGTAGSAG